uniref:DUF3685 domain-containing protein n=2 Tax=Kalanchoe fedtschenkoi TaxID=63787 RepID=A0A7N0UQK8_KALFE
MAECAAVPSHLNLLVRKTRGREGNSVLRCSHFGNLHSLQTSSASRPKFSKLRTRGSSIAEKALCFKKKSFKCTCLINLATSDAAIAVDWLPIADQVLLTGSILLTYMAGVIPTRRQVFISYGSTSIGNLEPETTGMSGRAVKLDDQSNLKHAWDVVKGKLVDSLNAMEHLSDLGVQIKEADEVSGKRALSLYAIADGPRLRLFCLCLQRLQEEVDNVPEESLSIDPQGWLITSGQVIQRSFLPVCMAWLEKELSPRAGTNVALSSMTLEKLQDNNILANIKKSGKEDLFSEFLCFLRFGSVRKGSFYDVSLFSSNDVSILEDMVITLADGIASIYLELISVDSNTSSEMHNVGAVLCTLSTRALQRLRNEVALNQWLHQNLDAVILMYEDRFDLRTLQKQFINEPSREQSENYSWWNKFLLVKSDVRSSTLSYVKISNYSMTVKRTNELRALSGWRYYFSLFIELSDITLPMIKTMISQVSNAISFFLVSLIGRSLGLIYTGIRQSIRWK